MSYKIQKIKIDELSLSESINNEDVFIESNGLETYKVAADDIAKYVSQNKHLTEKYVQSDLIGESNGIAPLNSSQKIDGKYITYGTVANTAYEGSNGKILEENLENHILDEDNPHKTNKSQIGLGNVDNTSDIDKPVSTAQQNAIGSAISNHDTSNSAHDDIRALISALTTRLNTLADSDDTTLDQWSEVVAYIKNNKSLIDGITTSKVSVSDIVNNLTSTATNKPLSANQGKVLKGLIDALTETVSTGVGVQSDWNVTDTSSKAYIKNKPTFLPANGGTADYFDVHLIATNTDLDTIATYGFYYSDTAGRSKTLANCPTERGFFMVVGRNVPIYQEIIECSEENPKRYMRNHYKAGTKDIWTEWYRVYTTADPPALPTPSDIGALALTGGTMTGAINSIYLKATNKPDNSGNACYLLLFDITTWYNSTTTGQSTRAFTGFIFSHRTSGNFTDAIEKINTGVSYKKTTSENGTYLRLRTSSASYIPCIIKNDDDSKYYLAIRMTGSGRTIVLMGRVSGTYNGTWVNGDDTSWTISGYTVINNDYKLLGIEGNANTATTAETAGTAGTATKLATARTIDGVSFDGSAAITHYGTCSTAAATAAKVVACTGFTLVTGATIRVKFTVTNTAANPTLNVNSTGAKAIYYRGSAISAGYLAANRTYEFVYNGTQYELVGDINTEDIIYHYTATGAPFGSVWFDVHTNPRMVEVGMVDNDNGASFYPGNGSVNLKSFLSSRVPIPTENVCTQARVNYNGSMFDGKLSIDTSGDIKLYRLNTTGLTFEFLILNASGTRFIFAPFTYTY